VLNTNNLLQDHKQANDPDYAKKGTCPSRSKKQQMMKEFVEVAALKVYS
jgi:hypothetical protein